MRRGVLPLDRLMERSHPNQVENRREGLGLHDLPLVARAHDRRLDEVAGTLEDVAAVQDLTARTARGAHRTLVALDRLRIDERSHQRALLERIADADLGVRVYQAPLELRSDRLVGKDATRRGATLARRADGPEHDGRHRQIEIRGVIHDHCIVAAELEQALAEPGRDALADLAPDLRRAGEGDECNAPVFDHPRGEPDAPIDERLEDTWQVARLEHPVAQ